MKKVKKVIIPVAGMGTRFLPVTKAIPKEMLPIIDKPTLQYIIEEAVNSGIEEVILVTNNDKKAIENHFERNYSLEEKLMKNNKDKELKMIRSLSELVKIHYVMQDEPLGSANAIWLARELIKDEPFAVMYGDDLIKGSKPALKQLIEVYEKYDGNVIGVQDIPDELVPRYGIIDYKDKKTREINGIIEKPSILNKTSNSAAFGRYIVKPEIFDEIEKIPLVNGEYLFTEAMTSLMKYQSFYACNIEGTYYDIGNKLGYLKANIEFALENDDLNFELKKYLTNLKINIDK